MTHVLSFAELSDGNLLAELHRLIDRERSATVALIACLAEVDSRRLYLGAGCRSLFAYCTEVLHLSEHAAYARIEAARACARFPVILTRIAEGDLTLTAVGILRPHLTDGNHLTVLDAAKHLSKRHVEELAASLAPKPDAPATIRKLPERGQPAPGLLAAASESPENVAPTAPQPTSAPSRPAAIIAPLAPERFKVQFTVSRETRDKLRRAQDLLRHSVPNGDPAEIFDRALTLLVEKLERTKFAAVKKPRRAETAAAAGSRHIPAAVKRAVAARDGDRCAFEGTDGRCTARGLLEFHHVVPFAEGGPATLENIQLRCRAHNQYEADIWFGPMKSRETPAPYGRQWAT